MTGDHAFNEVFFDEVRIPADHLVGEVNRGWRLAKVTLGNERVSLSGEGALWGRGPTAADLVERCAQRATLTALQRDDARARVVARARCCRCSATGSSPPRCEGRPPDPRRRCARRSPTTTAST